jgi:hypothetical protein
MTGPTDAGTDHGTGPTGNSLSGSLLRDVAVVVHRAFDGLESFSCLSGSTATGCGTATSDIDVLVVLPDRLPLPEAITRRGTFTQGYLSLHRHCRREPDRVWRGEGRYARDLAPALAGAAFDLASPARRLAPCPAEEPYRYWISMIASGTAVTGATEFSHASRRCASMIAHHLLHEAARRFPTEPPPWEVLRPLLQQDWAITVVPPETRSVLDAELEAITHRLRQEGPGFLAQWRAHLRQHRTTPPLDQHQERWRSMAIRFMQSSTDPIEPVPTSFSQVGGP